MRPQSRRDDRNFTLGSAVPAGLVRRCGEPSAQALGYYRPFLRDCAEVMPSGRKLGWFFALFTLALLTGCRTTPAPSLARFEFSEPHMGTVWRITLFAPDAATASHAVRAAFARVHTLDTIFTDYDPDSELLRLCAQRPGTAVPVSAELFDILQKSERLSSQTEGAFDVTVGPMVQLWRRARRQRELPAPEKITAARAAVGFDQVRLDARRRTVTLLAPGMRLDLGGIAKGYAADEALRVLRGNGISRALVAASGDLALGDAPPGLPGWRVEIALPAGTGTNHLRALTLKNCGISTSGDAEQYVELHGVRYSHLVDPRTGVGLTNRLQVTVLAECATRSDALTKTICVLGPARGLPIIERDARLAALVVTAGGTNTTVLQSRRFPTVK